MNGKTSNQYNHLQDDKTGQNAPIIDRLNCKTSGINLWVKLPDQSNNILHGLNCPIDQKTKIDPAHFVIRTAMQIAPYAAMQQGKIEQ